MSEQTNKIPTYSILDVDEAFAPESKDLFILPSAYQAAIVAVGSTASGTGYLQITVTAAGMTGSPKTINVNTTAGDTKPTLATAIATALNADADVSALFTALALSSSATSGSVQIMTKIQTAFDATLAMSIAAGTSGVTASNSLTTQPVVHTNVLYIPNGEWL